MSESTVTVGGGSIALGRSSARRLPQGDAPSELVTPRRLVWAAYAGLIICGLVAVLCTAHTPQLEPDSWKLAFPRTGAGPIAWIGPDIYLGGVIALFAVMCVCYATLIRHGALLSTRLIVAGVVALHVIMALAPPLMTTDVFSYLMYGRMDAIYHLNPYVYGPHAIFYDTYYNLVGARW